MSDLLLFKKKADNNREPDNTPIQVISDLYIHFFKDFLNLILIKKNFH